ncbi:trigger factor [Trueperella sp. LYQ141]|uniref:trigger factor n=1 Tax=Trueperella sp. LYQ141 TaxID=3391058 RepID=UPI0039830EC0
MKHNVEYLSETRAKLTVEVPAEEFEPAYAAAAKEVAKKVNIPGFRPGKAPRRVLESKIGRGYIIEQAINDNLDTYYQQALTETGVRPMARPQVSVEEVPEMAGAEDSTELKFTVEVDCRPEIWMPNPADFAVTVPTAQVTDEDVDRELDQLRERFATLSNVDRPAALGDYVTIDLVATIDDEQVDDVAGISYRIGDGNMLANQDEALTGAKAGDEVVFTTKLAGGEHEGEDATVTITVNGVKESVLPEADDDFAQMASEFDTIAELKEDLRKNAVKAKATTQLSGAYQQLLDHLLAASDFPLPESVVEEEVANHMRSGHENEDEEHTQQLRADVERSIRTQLLLDTYAEAFGVEVSQEELFDFLVSQAQMYGMEPNDFLRAAMQANQIGSFAGELARNKALMSALRLAKVSDESGASVDVAAVLGEAPENEKTPEFTAKPSASSRKVTAKSAASEESAKKPAKKAAQKPAEVKADAEVFNPADHTVDEVLEYAQNADAEEKARLLAAEQQGKARKTLIAKLEA